ncbi:MAG: lipopolysaccharide biosynthesis protein [Bacteroides sp.]|nr:lipopolysaccharide biosynthesis protein [Bacteroides sp.]
MPKSKTFIGILWASLQRFGTMIVAFISNIILARLLTPKDFGTVGMLLFFISISQVFIDSGFGAALIQKKNTTVHDYSTIFILNIVISIILYSLLFIASPWIAAFYDTPILTLMLRIEGLVLIGNAFCVIQTALLRKQMNFKKLAIANLIGNVVGSIIAIISAYSGAGVWSLIIRVLCVSYLTSACLWKISDWRPIKYFSVKIVKELFSFGGYMLLSTGLNTIASNLQTLIIGKLFHQRTLGLYTQAMNLRNVTADSLQNVIGQVLFPDFASLDSDKEIIKKLNNSFYIISYFTTACLTFLFIIGKPLIIFLYSEKWSAAVLYFQILCIGGIFYAIQDINYYVIAAKGKSKLLSYINMIKIPVYVVTLYLCGTYYGIEGLLWCIVGYTVVSYLIFAMVATSLLGTNIASQFVALFKSICFSLIASLGLGLIQKTNISTLPIYEILISLLVYLIIFILSSIIFKAYPLQYLNKLIRRNE